MCWFNNVSSAIILWPQYIPPVFKTASMCPWKWWWSNRNVLFSRTSAIFWQLEHDILLSWTLWWFSEHFFQKYKPRFCCSAELARGTFLDYVILCLGDIPTWERDQCTPWTVFYSAFNLKVLKNVDLVTSSTLSGQVSFVLIIGAKWF